MRSPRQNRRRANWDQMRRFWVAVGLASEEMPTNDCGNCEACDRMFGRHS